MKQIAVLLACARARGVLDTDLATSTHRTGSNKLSNRTRTRPASSASIAMQASLVRNVRWEYRGGFHIAGDERLALDSLLRDARWESNPVRLDGRRSTLTPAPLSFRERG
jgi:hypothetical protein